MLPPYMTAAAIAGRVAAGEMSAVEVVRGHLERIERLNPLLNAYTDITARRALSRAAEIDRRRSAGQAVGPLAGVPFAVKNLFDIEGLTTRAGSKINRENPPARADAELVRRLEAAGAVLLGALNMGEYAYDFTGENAHDGACRNPHDTNRMSGGSSSGSGAATAAGLAPISLGSDTNGSIRVPASLCGIFGLKPTYGRLTRHGTFPFVDSLDHVGPFARSVGDLALAYDAMQGPDPRDPVVAGRPAEPITADLDKSIEGLRIAIAGGWFGTGGLPDAAAAVETAAKALGADRMVDVPGAEAGRAAAFIITNAESAALHLNRLRQRPDDFDPDTRDRFLAGAMLPTGWLVRAQQVRRWYLEQVMALFREVDLLIAPSTPFSAPLIGQKTMNLRGEELAVRPNLGLFTQPVSCIGLPVAAVPIECGAAMPVGVQLIAPPWREDLALRAARHLEREAAAAARTPKL
ncbi:AtzE family amidohydrolase [Minwuia thermotolerans]|uniref:Asp-tRNA(Asn)/Glu-tRNA(Gln) amidotransferase GatCAB subunit A n=1 Tax=Minwuia thermotolerans TaxID=2056226 RepID=A0A2M9G3A9_9PROT|nr:AtzE family amidohydrolase [Minwuia thermotolerans]PJK30217.1 Asp-tRNA(Asn)/Glu-tRNA(Gln) amidotransferase GatCAB subunit A [Minwuia thermotolerans]